MQCNGGNRGEESPLRAGIKGRDDGNGTLVMTEGLRRKRDKLDKGLVGGMV